MADGFSFGGFTLGSTRQKSQGTSQSSSLDYGADVSQSFSDSLARSLSQAQGTSFSTQNVFNADLLKQLYSGALGAAGQTNAPLFQGQTAQLFTQGSQILDQLGVGAGDDYLRSRITDTSARDAQLAALKTNLGDLFRDELNPAITSRAVATGQLGGGRQGVAETGARTALGKSFAQGAAAIIGTDQAQRDAAASALNASQVNRAGAGIGALSPLLETAAAGFGAPLSPYASLAQILGGPTVLTQAGSQQTSTATSEQIAQAISQAFGFNYGTSQSSSQQSSKTKSFNFGI